MMVTRFLRLRTLVGVALVALVSVTTRAHSVVIQQELFVDPFTGGATSAPVYWIENGFQPCLTGVATGAASKIPNCYLAQPDLAGQGTLRLTENVGDTVSSIVYERLLPTNQGLRITFTQYQYGGFGLGGPGSAGGGDGIAFFLVPVPPHPSTIGEAGGALGYASSGGTVPGVTNGWLGVGLDAFGSFSDPNYSGAGCVEPTWGGSKPDAIVVRGPEHLGYCLLSSSAENNGTLPGGVSLRGLDRASSKRSIEILIDPFIPDPNNPGDTLPGTYTVSIDPAGGTNFVPVTSGLLPTSYFDAGHGGPIPHYPDLLTFGFSASTGSAADIHEISDVTVTTLNGEVPVLGLTKTNTLTGPAISGEQFEYVFTPRVDGNVPVQFPLHVRDRVPLGMALVGLPTSPGWTCFDDPTHVAFNCSYDPPPPYAPGTVFPELRALVELDTNLAPGAVLTNQAFTFSVDSVPGYATSVVTMLGNLVVTTTSLPGGTMGAPYNAALVASGGFGPYTWQVVSGALPPGLALGSSGGITGTPTTVGLSSFTAEVTDSLGGTANQALSINVSPAVVTITTSLLADGAVGTPYNASLAATGGTGVFSWTLESGALPAGLALSGAGAITGTPTVDGLASFTVRATDGASAFTTKALSIYVVAAPITITTAALPGGTVGTAYNASVAATGGSGVIVWTLDAGALPAGLSLSPLGAITGTPTAAGLASFTVRATDGAGSFATRALSIDVANTAVSITTAALVGGTVGTAYNAAVAATGGTGAITWTLDVGALPAGLVLSAAGAITGTPTAAGLANFTARATDGAGAFATKALSINVVNAAVTITTAALVGGTVGTAYNAAVAATGGTGAYAWTLDAGALPAGLALSAAGAITGTPTAAGLANFTARATDGAGAFATKALSINVVNAAVTITTAALAGGTVGTVYNAAVAATGGTGSFTWTLDSGVLPAGLGLAANGAITGTPTAAGLANFTARATDGAGAFATKALSINVVNAAVTITTGALAGGTVGTAYNAAVAATGGTGAITFTLESGSLPAGLALAANGAITGTPTAAGLANFTARATDGAGAFATKALSINVVNAAVTITTAALAGGTVGTAYNAALAATGGTGSFTWTLDAGALPAGLALAANGAITGTPTAAGLANFTVKATDSVGAFGTRALSINVVAPAVTITTAALAGGTVGTVYNAAVAATGGTGAITFALDTGALPAGLALAANGAITGTPTAAGLANFTVKATDSVGAFGTRALSINVVGAPVVITTVALADGLAGTAYNAAVAATGGTGAITFALDGGALPAGLALAANGAITGTPTTPGFGNFIVKATDSAGAFGTKLLVILVYAPPVTITTTALGGGAVGTAYNAAVAATGGVGAITFTLNSSVLPAGLSLSAVGAITGTPTAPGLVNFTVKATDSIGTFANKALSINVVGPAVTITTAALAGGTVGTAYNAALAATGGTGTFTWTLNGGALPAGLGLAVNGAITGTPSTAGLANFTVRATDGAGAFANKALSINVVAVPIVIVTAVQPDGVVGSGYHGNSMVATGGTAPYTWTIESGALPPGITLGAAGPITGIPTAAGLFNFTVRATDSVGAFAARALSINIVAGSTGPLRITTMAVPNGNLGVPYNAVLVASGGQWPYTWRVSNGQLPSGLSLSTTGVISGTPTSATQNGRFDVRVTDAAGARATRSLQIQVLRLTITGGSVPVVVWIGLPFNLNLTAAGGVLPLTWTAASALPQGLAVQSNPASLSGIPRTGSPTAITIRVTDAVGQTDTRTFNLNLNTVTFIVSPAGAGGLVGQPVRQVLQVYSYPSLPGPYTWSLVSGALPPGLSLAPNGTITGTPTAGGSYSAVFRVTTPDGFTATGRVLFFFFDLG